MTREEYLAFRNTNPAMVLYQYYVEKFDDTKHKPRLNFNELFIYLRMWTNVDLLIDKIIKEYDVTFSTTFVIDKHGNYIKMI